MEKIQMYKLLYFVLFVVCSSSYIHAMEQPDRTLRAGSHNIRTRIINATIAAIHHSCPKPSGGNDGALEDSLQKGSPEEFILELRTKMRNLMKTKLVEKGVKPAAIAQALKTHMAGDYIPVPRTETSRRASPRFRSMALHATRTMQGPPMEVVRDNAAKEKIFIIENTMFVNEKKLERAGLNTPRKIAAIARHEKAHAEMKDANFDDACDEVLRGLAPANPDFSPDIQSLRDLIARTGEACADLRSASESLETAENMLRTAQKYKETYVDRKFRSHPTHENRVKLAKLMVEFHKHYNAQPPQVQKDSRKPVKRRLFEDTEQESKKARASKDKAS